ncbi:MAG: rhodanese-like domain-containing protein [Bacteroidota bacterium]|nr:rhodanese-like domain-containing protein [Bacteroidota bacterium]
MEATGPFEVISTDSLAHLIYKENIRLIDIRSPGAYNGWPLINENRGGHIKNAKSLPCKWADYIDWIEIVRHKGIKPEHDIIIYGYDINESIKVAERFVKAGYNKPKIYTSFINEWSARQELPMQRLERYRHLVSPEWVNSLINGKRPLHFENDKYILVHAHYRNRDAYLSGHIPGAIDMDTLALEAPETWNRRSPSELKEALEGHGITADTTVVVYGKFMFPDNNDPFPGSAAGDIGAIRCAFIMMYAGVKDVRVLNGGFRAWTDEGYEVAYNDEPKRKVEKFGASIPAKPQLTVDTPEAKKCCNHMIANWYAYEADLNTWVR